MDAGFFFFFFLAQSSSYSVTASDCQHWSGKLLENWEWSLRRGGVRDLSRDVILQNLFSETTIFSMRIDLCHLQTSCSRDVIKNLLSESAVFSMEIDLCHLETSYSSWISPAPSLRLASL